MYFSISVYLSIPHSAKAPRRSMCNHSPPRNIIAWTTGAPTAMTSLWAVAQSPAPKINCIAIPMSMILQDRLMMFHSHGGTLKWMVYGWEIPMNGNPQLLMIL